MAQQPIAHPERNITPLPQANRVGDRLVQRGSITADHLQIALHEQRRTGDRLGAILVRLGFLNEQILADVLAERTGYASIELKDIIIDQFLLCQVPSDILLRHKIIPIALSGATLQLAVADPYDIVGLDEARRHFPNISDLEIFVASVAEITEALVLFGDHSEDFADILHELEIGKHKKSPRTAPDDWEHPVIRIVDMLMADAVRCGASDIHIEPESQFIRIRYRIDGLMQQKRILHRAHWPEISHRIKIMAGMNIADQRSMQDGRFALTIGSATIDFRVAIMPTVNGENIVIRVLDHRRAMLPLHRLGFSIEALSAIDQLLERPEGIILVTGPTGCGKTTTLYSMLSRISTVAVNIMTLEEPVEYRLELIRQTAVRDEQGVGFASGVRGILRQDPDIIFIGEVRDHDTAQMALRSAMTGHRVFSTLHCNDALGALPRLIDLGLHPRMMSGHVTGVIAQRLVRKLCPLCKSMRAANDDEMVYMRHRTKADALPAPRGFAERQSPFGFDEVLSDSRPMIGVPVGCRSCDHSGYHGRMVVAEVLRVTSSLDNLIADDASRKLMQQQLQNDGFRTIADDGLAKVLAGEISLESLRRAVDLTRGR